MDVPTTRRRAGVFAVGVAVVTGGAVLLGVEIAASRVVAPYFGSSLFVWGALIGVVLSGLAVGYWAGGTLADRIPAAGLLVYTIALGALLVLLVPVVDEPVLEAVVRWDPGPRLNPLVAAIALFGPLSVVLAAVTPIAVRLATRSVGTVGRTAGRLFALSTAGSIAGTFATAFFLLPVLGTEQLLAAAAATLFAAVLVVAVAERLWVAAAAGAAATIAAAVVAASLAPEQGGRLTGAATQNWSPLYRLRGDTNSTVDHASQGFRVLLRRDTRYHRLAVVEDDEGSRYLRFDNSYQSGMYVRRPFATRFRYTDFFFLGAAYAPSARDWLFIGLGGGSAPKRLWRDFPTARIDAVELDPVVVDAAYRYFALPRGPRLRVEVEDGRRYLVRRPRTWDAIAIDAFYADSVPFHLTTAEFVQLVRERLAPGGVVLVNVIGAVAGPQSQLLRSFVRTYRTAFPTVVLHPVTEPGDGGADAIRNVMLVATDRPAPEVEFLLRRWRELRKRVPTAPDLTGALRSRRDVPVPTDDVPTLTDDYAPTDALLLID